jgi:hypothetical protein
MKDAYDFSDTERGKFYRLDAHLIPPAHLNPEVPSNLVPHAEAGGSSVTGDSSQAIAKDIKLI